MAKSEQKPKWHGRIRVKQKLTNPLGKIKKSDRLLTKAPDDLHGEVTIGGFNICNLPYANCTILIAAWKKGLVRVEETSNNVDLQTNREKTKIVMIDRQNNNMPDLKKINNIETVVVLISLGTTASNKGGFSEQVSKMWSMEKPSHIP